VDFHTLDEAVLQRVNVLDHSIEQQFPPSLAYYLMYSYDNAAGRIGFDRLRFYVRIDHSPLPCPVGADAFVSMDPSAFHSVRPIDFRRHCRERTINVAGVEGGIGLLYQFDGVV